MTVVRYESPSARHRRERALEFLTGRPPSQAVWVVGHQRATARKLVRAHVARHGAAFGVESTSLAQLARHLARPALIRNGQAFAGSAAQSAVAARVLRSEAHPALERVADAPGLPRALAEAAREVREARCLPQAAQTLPTIAPLLKAYSRGLADWNLVDHAERCTLAAQALADGEVPPLLFLDPAMERVCDRELFEALVGASPEVLVVAHPADGASNLQTQSLEQGASDPGKLGLCQTRLFPDFGENVEDVGSDDAEAQEDPDATRVVFLSAPGEARECIEVARRILMLARRGVSFDQVGVIVHAAERYRPHLASAFRRAGVPAAFTQGTTVPDPAGRALLSLLECADRDLSARSFAEYLAFGMMPKSVSGAPPPARELFVPEEEGYGALEEPVDLVGAFLQSVADDPYEHDRALHVPLRFEELLIDAAVIGSRTRWEQRLRGLQNSIEAALQTLEDPSGAKAARLKEQASDLTTLQTFALPILDDLAALPQGGSWGDWIAALSALSTRALHAPERVLQVLETLRPMAAVAPISLREVRRALHRPLSEVRLPCAAATGVHICDTQEIRGRSFAHVFVLGLAEKLFPARIISDPLVPDDAREKLDGVATRDQMAGRQRLALHLAVGSASESLTLCWPRLDTARGRPRVASFYVLEAARAIHGRLPDIAKLERAALNAGRARLGWPAPPKKEEAIDDAEYDVAACAEAYKARKAGGLAYALKSNPHLARAFRRRARSWDTSKWTRADGMVNASLGEHALSERPYSATGLQRFAACPLQFAMHQILRLQPREVPEAIDQLDPRQRGSLVHSIQFQTLTALRERSLWPLTHPQTLQAAYAVLAEIVQKASEHWARELVPAIPRVWQEGVAAIESDLRRWLREMPADWKPVHYELSFGIPNHDEQDAASVPEPVQLASGIRLRGAIDVVERHEEKGLRATDHKTGRNWTKKELRIGGGETLQPALYAMALEAHFGDKVDGGRLHFCTSRGAFRAREVPLTDEVRRDVQEVADALNSFVKAGFLPAHPAREKTCEWCDYRIACGPDEFARSRSRKKETGPIKRLNVIREKP